MSTPTSLDTQNAWRLRFGQSKVPFGSVNMQSSQNRAPLERPDALNSAVEGERDLGAALMWRHQRREGDSETSRGWG
ncbi:MAG: hypothetical protein FJW27_18680 [Acidimicrobiia bacterium]|nr:hypothetical protein [Acidimicrobiia bacterium]